ncbi:hypothetical protein [Nocardia sp. CA-290969]|uniref:hypothetical protein n=1 Tax=Nocardia sp. CA-290969 TaxID=3239986 RepID=UPI003D925788
MADEPDSSNTVATFGALAIRARRSGYQLTRGSQRPEFWSLLDAEDGETLHTASSLTEIARYLDE